ncbi:MAG: DinB family protein [Armatimonadetes bacterium]|nr:DinB family protein [Armatimonadota bacterium]
MTQEELIDSCLAQGREFLDRGKRIGDQASVEALNRKGANGEWSPAQVYRHLILANDPYSVKAGEAAAVVPRTPGDTEFKFTFAGKLIYGQAGPSGNVPAPKPLIAEDRQYDKGIVEEWAQSHQRMLDVIEMSRGKDLNIKSIRNPFIKVIRINLGDAIMIFTTHTERHLAQIEERIQRD